MDLLAAANMLELPRLVNICEQQLSPLLNAENVVAVYLAAQHHRAKQLEEQCVSVVEGWSCCDNSQSSALISRVPKAPCVVDHGRAVTGARRHQSGVCSSVLSLSLPPSPARTSMVDPRNGDTLSGA